MTTYAMGTELRTRGPWSLFSGGRALCSDGKVRALARVAQSADTFFSVPAAVKVRGRTVTGYVSVSTADGFDTTTDDNPTVVTFHAVHCYANGALLPHLVRNYATPREVIGRVWSEDRGTTYVAEYANGMRTDGHTDISAAVRSIHDEDARAHGTGYWS